MIQTFDEPTDPIVLKIKNYSDEPKKFILFGFNDFNLKKRFGNPKRVEIIDLMGNSYARVLSESGLKGFNFCKFKIECSQGAKLYPIITQTWIKATGTSLSKPIIILKDALQFQPNMVEVVRDLKITGNTYLQGQIAQDSFLILTFWPEKNTNKPLQVMALGKRGIGKTSAKKSIKKK